MNLLLIAPIAWPLLSATLLFLLRSQREATRVVSTASAALGLIVALVLLFAVRQEGILAVTLGSWPAPFGITLVADHLAAIMVLITGVMGAAVAVYALRDIDAAREGLGYHPLYHLLLMGINGAFLTGDLFNLYVWFEVLLIASFVLLTLGGDRAQLIGGVKYVSINLVASLLFLAGVGLLYGLTGSLNFADLALTVAEAPLELSTAVAMLLLVAFGIKAAVFPLFFWLPASYHTPPVAISAIFAAMLTKVGVYALIRTFTLIFVHDVAFTHHTLLLIIAAATMVTGVLGAAAQHEFRKILSFHIISQIGYMVLGLALFTPLGLLGAVFYLVHNIIAKGNLFLVAGLARWVGGSFLLERIGGLYRARPLHALLFLIPAFSLAGFPPLSGFWAKLLVIQAGVVEERWWVVVVALAVGLLTIYSMTKIWQGAYWSPAPEGVTLRPNAPLLMLLPIAALALITVVIGLWSGPFVALAEATAAELMAPSRYIEAVLGVQP